MFDLIFIFYDCYNHCFFLFLHSFPVFCKKSFLLLWDSSPLKDEYSYSHKSQLTQGKESGRERKMDIKAWNLGSNFKAVIWLKKFRLPYRTFLPFSVIFVTFRTPHFSDGCGGKKTDVKKNEKKKEKESLVSSLLKHQHKQHHHQGRWSQHRGADVQPVVVCVFHPLQTGS